MSHLDTDVHNRFMLAEHKLTYIAATALKRNGLAAAKFNEKIHITYNLIESFCHEYVFHKHDFINYSKMKTTIINVILS